MISCPSNVDPLTPRFYIVKLRFTGVYIFLIFARKHRLWVLVKTASIFYLKIIIFTAVKYCSILHGRVCVKKMNSIFGAQN